MYNYEIIEKDCKLLYNSIDISKVKNSKVLITGANGLIGSFLADYFNFLNKTHDYQIDIYITSYSAPESAHRIKHLIGKPRIKYFSWDASQQIDRSVFEHDIDYVFFCSGYGQPAKFTKDIVKTSFINTVGVESLLKYLESLDKNTNFLFLSTSEIYGEPDVKNIPTSEEYEGILPASNNRASYIVSKRLGEIICSAYAENSKIKTKVARVGLMYGPGTLSNDNRVLQELIFKATNDRQINLLDDGSALRNYLYLTDGIEMLLNIVVNSESKEMIYNVGGDLEPITIYELAKKIGFILKCDVNKGTRSVNAAIANAPKNVYMNMNRYRSEFKEKNNIFVPLDKGIQNVIKWYNFTMENK
jgi:dTDP-glucose 4,6-dehydratase/UDP-glucuronate decarboxylase